MIVDYQGYCYQRDRITNLTNVTGLHGVTSKKFHSHCCENLESSFFVLFAVPLVAHEFLCTTRWPQFCTLHLVGLRTRLVMKEEGRVEKGYLAVTPFFGKQTEQ
jgi:hypothetical protein